MTLALEISQTIAAPLSRVFAAWVDPVQMAGYFISRGSGPMEAGSTVTWEFDDHGDAKLEIRVAEVDPDARLRFSWSATGEPTDVDVDFESVGERRTKVTVRERGWPMTEEGVAHYGGQIQGWTNMLDCLKAYLEHWEVNLRDSPAGHYAMTLTRTLALPPATVYDAFSTGWERWFAAPGSSTMHPEVGAPYWFEAIGPEERRYAHHGRFLALAKDRLVELTWCTVATHGAETRLRVELSPEGEGTKVTMLHDRFEERGAMEGHQRNWPLALDHLESVLAGA